MRMMKIVSIGGGSIARPKKRPETMLIDETIVKMSGKKRPRVLFIPTASGDSQAYVDAFIALYAGRLGCEVEVLTLYRDRPSKKDMAATVARADVIYVGGGNTLRMLKLWRRLGVDKMLITAARRGAVCCGLSAGAICWFREGNSDSLKYSNPAADYIRVKTLDLADALLCPHYDAEKDRQPSLKRMMKKVPGVAIALDNCAAVVIEGSRYRIISTKKKAKAYRICWRGKEYVKEELNTGDLSELLGR